MRFACRVTKARIQTYTQNMLYLLLFHCNYLRERSSVLRTLTVMLAFRNGADEVLLPRQWVLGARRFGWACLSHLQGSNVHCLTL
jgi:hypothetical protein